MIVSLREEDSPAIWTLARRAVAGAVGAAAQQWVAIPGKPMDVAERFFRFYLSPDSAVVKGKLYRILKNSLLGLPGNNLKLLNVPVVLRIVRYQGHREYESRGRNPRVGRTDATTFPCTFFSNRRPRGAQHVIRMKHQEISQVGLQQSALARAPRGFQGALAHFGQSHERNDQLRTAHNTDVAWRELRMPLENKADDVSVKHQSCCCSRRSGQSDAAHRCGGRTLRPPPQSQDRRGSADDPARTHPFGSDWADP
jgi:hypothetical protein